MPLRRTRPPEHLAAELIEVSERARDFADEVSKANNLPKNFPKASMLEVSSILQNLINGTGEGARIPLDYSRYLLSAVRSVHILPSASEDDHPISRGSIVDKAFADLISCTSTALEVYRTLVANERGGEDFDDIEVGIDSLRNKNRAIEISEDLSASIGGNQRQAHEFILPDSKAGENFKRALVDVENYNRVVQIELRKGRVRGGWFRFLSETGHLLPVAVSGLGKAIKITVDVVQPLARQWDKFMSDLQAATFANLKELAVILEVIANDLKKDGRRVDGLAAVGRGEAGDPQTAVSKWCENYVRMRGGEVEYSGLVEAARRHFALSHKDIAAAHNHQSFKELINSFENVVALRENGSQAIRVKIISPAFRAKLDIALDRIRRAVRAELGLARSEAKPITEPELLRRLALQYGEEYALVLETRSFALREVIAEFGVVEALSGNRLIVFTPIKEEPSPQ